MTETERIADQLHRAFYGPAWHGPAWMELLREVDAAKAAAHPIPGAHSIWDVVRHVTVWNHVTRRRVAGEVVKINSVEEDWPPVTEFSESSWRSALHETEASLRLLLDQVRALSAGRLDERLPGEQYSVYFILHGTVQHILYHAGQIALLKKGS
jgi:uncharacterized damage-inducible protein DinB